ncbi:MAG: hypothetical protein K9W44_18320 [Candidatus Lokiarchaeota archaeon]|nr:hypothetical protein [Candidatus Harpocratesius repetitus]
MKKIYIEKEEIIDLADFGWRNGYLNPSDLLWKIDEDDIQEFIKAMYFLSKKQNDNNIEEHNNELDEEDLDDEDSLPFDSEILFRYDTKVDLESCRDQNCLRDIIASNYNVASKVFRYFDKKIITSQVYKALLKIFNTKPDTFGFCEWRMKRSDFSNFSVLTYQDKLLSDDSDDWNYSIITIIVVFSPLDEDENVTEDDEDDED